MYAEIINGGSLLKAEAIRLLEFMRKGNQFVIPIYQRMYSWDEKQCNQLWQDILRVGSNKDINGHFVGSIVYVADGLSTVSVQAPLLVVDGQQRLTTLTLLLEALARTLKVDEEPIDGFSSKKLRHNYLTNPLEEGNRYLKLVLSENDKLTLDNIIRNYEIPANYSLRIKENFDYFLDQISENRDRISEICSGIAKLIIVDIALSRDQDNPQLIFESMNSTGKALSEADLIRNYILMGLEPKLQEEIYLELWRPMELDFGQSSYDEFFDDFMRHYLTIRTGDIPRMSEVYEAFKEYHQQFAAKGGSVKDLVQEIRTYSKYFVKMSLSKESNVKLKNVFNDLFVDMNYSVAMPLAMEMYADFERGDLSESDFLDALKLIESYIFRRSICEVPTNSMNKTFAEFIGYINKASYLESIKAHFLLLKSYRRFPTDEEFAASIQTKNLYSYNLRTYLLRKLENDGRKEPVSIAEYSIEHIMPQNENISEAWQNELGPNWREVWQQYLHTLGNLTLTGYNSEYSDRPFAEKRDMERGFKSSPLILNEIVRTALVWNEEMIKLRAEVLTKKALDIWKGVHLEGEKIAKYQIIPKQKLDLITYTREDHELLNRPHTLMLFEALRKEVLALDPNITETYLKYYVAYKAQTNFIDVVPKALGLRLSLNMKFPELHDPRKMAVDVSGKGRWGNGDVSINFRDIKDLPYVMSLVQQSLAKQQ